MATYAVESSRQAMTGTGIVEPIQEWEETPDGRRRPAERQARDEDTGMPLWAVEVLYTQSAFGRLSTVTAKVTVGAPDEPTVAKLTPVVFTGLVVEVRINKAGGFGEYWRAAGLQESSKSASKATGTSAPSTPSAA